MTCAEFLCPFQHRTGARESAERLRSPLVQLEPDSSFLDIVRRPRFNFGGGPLSCLECRLRMLSAANSRRPEFGSDLLVTGEVLGQRASNQSRRQLDLIAFHVGAGDALLRPLSSALLNTAPLLQGEMKLESRSISGSGRRPIKSLAKQLGIDDVDRPGPQCRLQDPGYTARLDDLLIHQADADFVDIELLLLGRHYRLHRQAKAIVGRNAADNAAIANWHLRHGRGQLFVPANFQGPSILLFSSALSDVKLALSLAASRKKPMPEGGFQFRHEQQTVLLANVIDVTSLSPLTAT
jgi:tRNA-uridine 2-sulfurtransferase